MEKNGSLIGGVIGGHVVQNVATRARMKSPKFWDRVGNSFLRGLGHHSQVDKVVKNKGADVVSGALVPEENILMSHAHHAGKDFLGEVSGKPTYSQKKALAALRMAGRGEFTKIQRRNLHKLPEVQRMADRLPSEISSRVKNMSPLEARVAEKMYESYSESPAVQTARYLARKKSKEVIESAGREKGSLYARMGLGVAPLVHAEPGMALMSASKMALGHQYADKVKPIAKAKKWIVDIVYKKPAVKSMQKGEAGKPMSRLGYHTKSIFVNPVAAEGQRLAHEFGSRHSRELQLLRSAKNQVE